MIGKLSYLYIDYNGVDGYRKVGSAINIMKVTVEVGEKGLSVYEH